MVTWKYGGFKGVKLYIFIIYIFVLLILIIDYLALIFIYQIDSDINSLSILPLINSISNTTLHTITGNILGDGSISLSKINKGEGKYSMTMDVYSLNYLNYLNENIYSQFTNTKIYAYPNILLPQHKGKEVTQYHFKTKTHSLFTALHNLWYKWDNEKNKIHKNCSI